MISLFVSKINQTIVTMLKENNVLNVVGCITLLKAVYGKQYG